MTHVTTGARVRAYALLRTARPEPAAYVEICAALESAAYLVEGGRDLLAADVLATVVPPPVARLAVVELDPALLLRVLTALPSRSTS